jgi:hypothetical protein
MNASSRLLNLAPRRGSSATFLRAAAAASILSGPIYAQTIPPQSPTRAWDNSSGDLLWSNDLNWAGDAQPGPDEIANINLNTPALTAVTTIDLGGTSHEIGALLFGVNTPFNYQLSNGTIVTNSISQTQDDPNQLIPSALVTSKNNGADVLRVNISSNQLQLQGKVTSGGLIKSGGSTLRLGTSGTNFENAINGDIVIYGGTLTAAAASALGVNNPLGGSGDVVIGASGVTLSVTAQVNLYDFVRNIVANDNSFTLNVTASTGDPGDFDLRVGTVSLGDATLSTTAGAGYRAILDGLAVNDGKTASINAATTTRIEGLAGSANTKVIKLGASDTIFAGDATKSFAGDFELQNGNLRFETVAGANPLGSAQSEIAFGGIGTLQLRSESSSDFAASVAFKPGIIAGTINVDRVSAATGQTLSAGALSLPDGVTLNITGANSYALSVPAVNLDPGATAILSTNSANTTTVALSGNAAATLLKRGANTLTVSGDNSTTFLGNLMIQGGAVTASAASALGSKPIIVGDSVTLNPTGTLTFIGRLNVNASGFTANNGTEPDVTVHASSMVDLNVVPALTDTFRIKDAGVILANLTQMPALDAGPGGNLILEPGAVLAFEVNASPLPLNLPSGAQFFYGVGATLSNDVTIGAGTPWKGISNDQSSRVLSGVAAGTSTVITINGGDDNPDTIEGTLQGLNGATLSFGTTSTTDGAYNWATSTAKKTTLAIRGVGGNQGTNLTPGGIVAMEDSAATTSLASVVDKIVVQSGSLLLGPANSLGGVIVDVLGALDVRTTAAIDGPVNIKRGGLLWLNDAFQMTGSGTITVEGGGKVDLLGAPANILSSPQAVNFTGDGHTVRFNANDMTNLSSVPANGVTYVVGAAGTSAVIPNTNVNAITNTQSSGLSLLNGILTNDGSSRGFAGPIALNNSNLTVAATRNTSFVVTSDISTTGTVNIGSEAPIDSRFKNDPNATRADGLPDPFNSPPQVYFTGAFHAGTLQATGTHLGFANADTNITGDLNFQANVLYLDGGGGLNGGSSTRGDLTPRLTDTSNTPAGRIANRIILGNFGRIEMSVTSDATGTTNHTITQPFVIEGAVNPLDKRTFWVDRGTGAATTNVFFNDILLRPNAQLGFDESNTVVRSNVRLEGNASFIRLDDWDLRNVTREPGAPASVTVSVGQPSTAPGGSSGNLIQSVDGTVDAGITFDLIRGQLFFEAGSTLNGVVRAQTAPVGGDAFIVFRSNLTTDKTFASPTAEVQVGRSGAANGPEDLELRGAEVTAAPGTTLRLSIPVRVVNDGDNTNIDAIVRSNRNNDSTVLSSTFVDTINVDPGARVQFNSQTQTPLTIPTINLPGGGGIDGTNTTSVFIGNINGAANPVTFTGPAQSRVTGNIVSSGIVVSGAGIDFDPGFGNTSTVGAPVSLSGRLSVRTGTADLGANLITGVPPQTVAGLRENKTQGSFDVTTPNFSNKIALGTDFAQAPTLAWGENQTVTYTGRINIPDNGTPGDGQGSVSFAKSFDDSTRIDIDGAMVMRSTAFNDAVGTGAINLTAGWHDIEIRLGQGTGGAGPVVQDGGGFGLGLGIDLTDPVDNNQNGGVGNVFDFRAYVAPVDSGSQNLFQTTTLKGSLAVAADATLKARAFTTIGTVSFGGANSVIDLAGTEASDADALVLSSGANGTLRTAGPLTAGRIDLDGELRKEGPGTLIITGAGTGSGFNVVDLQGGALLLDAGAVLTGSALVNAGTVLRGSGTITSTVTAAGGTVAPGNEIGSLTLNGIDLQAPSRLELQLNGTNAGATYDRLVIPGTSFDLVSLGGTLAATLGFIPAAGDAFIVILNNGTGSLSGTFANAPTDGGTIMISGVPFTIDYTFAANPDALANDLALIAQIPEPGAITLLFTALGSFLGLARCRRLRMKS